MTACQFIFYRSIGGRSVHISINFCCSGIGALVRTGNPVGTANRGTRSVNRPASVRYGGGRLVGAARR